MGELLAVPVSDVPPGTYRAYQVGGRAVLVFNRAGEFSATQGLCPHEDLPLEGGRLTENVIECPWHGSRFNIATGKVLNPPAEAGLQTFPVRVEGETVIITVH